MLGSAWRYFWLSQLGGGAGELLLASRECSSEMLLIILQCIWHPPPCPTSHRVIRPQMSIAKTEMLAQRKTAILQPLFTSVPGTEQESGGAHVA